MPIFTGGHNTANLDLATVRKDMVIADYEKNIQIAFRDVAYALAATDNQLYRELAVPTHPRKEKAA